MRKVIFGMVILTIKTHMVLRLDVHLRKDLSIHHDPVRSDLEGHSMT